VRFAQPGFNNDDLVDQNGDQADGMTKTKTVIVKLPPNANIDDKIAEYLARPDVAFAEPNAVVSSSDDYTAGRHGRLGHDHRPDGHGSDSRGRHGSDGDDGHRPDDHRPDGGGNDGFDDDDGDDRPDRRDFPQDRQRHVPEPAVGPDDGSRLRRLGALPGQLQPPNGPMIAIVDSGIDSLHRICSARSRPTRARTA
jgi:fervidolysin-like protein